MMQRGEGGGLCSSLSSSPGANLEMSTLTCRWRPSLVPSQPRPLLCSSEGEALWLVPRPEGEEGGLPGCAD